MSIIENRLKAESEILKKIKRGILKSAKKNELFYYWETTGLSDSMIRSIVTQLEEDNKMVKSKGPNYKIIRW